MTLDTDYELKHCELIDYKHLSNMQLDTDLTLI